MCSPESHRVLLLGIQLKLLFCGRSCLQISYGSFVVVEMPTVSLALFVIMFQISVSENDPLLLVIYEFEECVILSTPVSHIEYLFKFGKVQSILVHFQLHMPVCSRNYCTYLGRFCYKSAIGKSFLSRSMSQQ
jgi:hypothetical protein